MTRIVATTYRYKRPPRKRKATEIEGSAIVRKRGRADALPPDRVEEPAPGNDNRPEPKSAIVTIKRKSRFGDAPNLTPEELQRRGEAADALWHSLVDRATAKDRP
jgi:hypothetical protein